MLKKEEKYMAKSSVSSRNIVNTCCFWAVVLSGIASLVSAVLGWCKVGGAVVGVVNSISHIIMLVGVVLGGFFYVSNVTGKYRGLWIALFVIGVLMGILGITVGLGLF